MTESHFLPVSIEIIQARVAQYYRIPRAELTSARQQRIVVRPRQIAMYLARELTPHSVPTIAACFSRDPSTIHHAWTNIKSLAFQDPALRKDLEKLRRDLAAAKGHDDVPVELAVDMLLKALMPRLRQQLLDQAKTDPVGLVEQLKDLKSPKRRLDS